MTSPVSFPRCEPDDLLPVLSPGQVIGLYQGSQWIDWSGPPTPAVTLVSPGRPERLWTVERKRFHLIVDTQAASSAIGACIDFLVNGSKGMAIVSSRLGVLLRWASRIVSSPAYPPRNSGPVRSRTSGALLVLREATLRVVERAQVLDSATLSVVVPEPARAVRILEPSFPDLRADSRSLHLPLRGHHPEEVLGRLRQEGLPVTGSAVWYRLLQSCPLG